LAKRLSQGPLPLTYALQCATDVANSIRELHEQGRLHGSVNANSVIVTAAGAQLMPPNGQARYTVPGADVAAFGSLLYEILTGEKPSPRTMPPPTIAASRSSPRGLRIAAMRLAAKCLRSTSNSFGEMQKVLTEVRLLGLQAKISEKPAPVGHAASAIAPPATPLFTPAEPNPAPRSRVVSTAPPPPPSRPMAFAESPIYTSLPAKSFMARVDEEGNSDRPPSGVACPVCGVPYVYPSKSRNLFEMIISAWQMPILRCHRCLYRYVVVFGRFRFAKGSQARSSHGSPA